MSRATGTTAARAAAPRDADSHDLIRVHGARENNLKDVSLEIPKRRLTVFTGVSGSGKSSLVFDTIAAESQRLINETYSAFVQGFMPALARPDVDVLDGLTTAIIVDQRGWGPTRAPRSAPPPTPTRCCASCSAGSGEPHIGSPQAFSFNVASVSGAGAVTLERGGQTVKERRSFSITGGMCPRCEGRGAVSDIDLARAVRRRQVAQRGRAHHPRLHAGRLGVPAVQRVGVLRPGQADPQVHQEGAERLPVPRAGQDEDRGHQPDLRGPGPAAAAVHPVEGPRRDAAAHPGVRGPRRHLHHLPGVRRHPAGRARQVLEDQRDQHRRRVRDADQRPGRMGRAGWTSRRWRRCSPRCGSTLDSFTEIGLGYLSLDRTSGSLSGGEAQRVKMIRQLGSSLTDVTYVFDEPTVGLHPHDIERMNGLLLRLRDKGNTVLVVEHKPEMIAIGDHVVDLGPGAGTAGGSVCFEGTVEGLRASGTVTGRHLDDRATLKPRVRAPRRRAGDPARDHAQPARRQRRRAARRAVRRHRGGRVRQELAHPRVGPAGRGRRLRRPGRHPRLAAQQPGDLHRAARPDPRARSPRPTA